MYGNYKRGLEEFLKNIDSPDRLKKAIDAASRKGEQGFIARGNTPYTDPQLEQMSKDHLDVLFTRWEGLTESNLARQNVHNKLRQPMMERMIVQANDPVLTSRWEALKSKAAGTEMTDPAVALNRVVGGQTFTPRDLAHLTLR
jgi:hypothetical protein